MPRLDLDITANMAVLEPYLPLLSGCVKRAFTYYQTAYPALAHAAHDNAASAKNVHRHILDEVTVASDGLSGLSMIDVRGLFVLNIHDLVVVRFKKMDDEGRSVSYPTEQAKKYDRQLPLPELPVAATRLTFGYEPDLAFSAIIRVLVACPLGLRAHWCVQVNEEEAGAASWVDITPQRLPGTERFRPYGISDV